MVESKGKSWVRKSVVATFVSVPFLSSIISTIHLVRLFDLGNVTPMSLTLAIAFELGSVAAFLVPAVLPSIKRGLVYTIFIVLAAMQIIGNIFSSYDFIFEKVKVVPTWLDSFVAFISNFGTFSIPEVTLYLAILIGLPIPLIALFFLKSWMDYLHIEDGSEEQKEIKNENIEKPLAVDSGVLSGLEDGKANKEESGATAHQHEEYIIPQGVIDSPKEGEITELIEEPINEFIIPGIEPDSEVAILQNNNIT